jgi:prepilin-type N-terminal cleavage/methylation domain-containing protein
MKRVVSRIRTRKGFTLVELAVVIVIIGVLAAFGVPKFLQSVEKSKAAEAFNYWGSVQAAQERYIAQNGVYASWDGTLANNPFDITLPTLQYFSLSGAITPSGTGASSSGTPSWTGTLSRIGSSSSWGTYTVVWGQNGYDTSSTIPQAISPVTGDGASSSSSSSSSSGS